MAKNTGSSTALTAPASPEKLAALSAEFPKEASFQRVLLPRLTFKSQDVFEGVGKAKKVVVEAGTFFREFQKKNAETGELIISDETGKPEWDKEELGSTIEGTIIYQRKQLSYYDSGTDSFTSSPVFDEDTEVIPLFRDRAEVDKGTPAELKAREEYQGGKTAAGKPKSKLEDNRILYVIYEGQLHTLSMRGSSMYAYLTYVRKCRPSVPAVITILDSEPKENGSIAWNQMTFETKRTITSKEADIVVDAQTDLKESIAQEKAFYAAANGETPAEVIRYTAERKEVDRIFDEHKPSSRK